MGGWTGSSTSPGVVSPFGQMPYNQAGRYANQFANPLTAGLGFGATEGRGSRQYGNFMDQLSTAEGPTADYIRQSRSFLPSVFGQAQDIGTQMAARAPQLYNQVQGQISNFLGQLPNLQKMSAGQSGEAGQLYGRASQAVQQAFSPVASNALTSNALRNTLQQTRGAAGGRGLLDAGTAQASEENIAQQMYGRAAEQQFGQQQAALGGAGAALQGQQAALGQQAGLAGAGIQPASQGMEALNAFVQQLQQGYQIPMGALSQVFGQLQGGTNPTLALLSQILPQVASHGSAKGGNIL